jgi:cysteine-S-conjugate beta-lyase
VKPATTVLTTAGVELPTVDELRARGSAKWTRDPGALGASVAEMDFGLAPEIVEAVAGTARRAALGYLPPPLARDLAEATAELQDAEFGWRVPAERVVAVGDVIVGLETVIEHFTEPGSAVVVLTPAYMPFLTVPRRLGRAVVEVPLRCTAPGSWELDPERLDAALRGGAGLVVLCNPHNPLGKVYRPDELVTIAEAVDRHGARVFADEIHGLLTYPGHVHRPYADLTPETARHTVTATSASKSWNIPGLKCAQLILAEDDGPAWAAARHSASRGASNPGAEATIAAYRHGRPWLDAVRALLDRNRALLAELVEQHLPEVATAEPDATYLAWLDFRQCGLGPRPAEFFLREARVALTGGELCGAAGAGFARLNFATPAPVLEQIVESMGRALAARGG